MTVKIKDFDDFRNRILSFRDLTAECIPAINDTGRTILNAYKGVECPREIVFCHDLLKRIRDNLYFVIQSPPPQPNTVIPIGLILRSVFSDLIFLTYVIYNIKNKDVLNKFLAAQDFDAVEGKIAFAESEIEFVKICGLEELVPLLESKKADLSNTFNEILASIGSKNQKNKMISGVTGIAHYFLRTDELTKFFSLLFGPFKLLSQIEHFANENRSLSYFNETTAFEFQKLAVSYNRVILCLCRNIQDYISQ